MSDQLTPKSETTTGTGPLQPTPAPTGAFHLSDPPKVPPMATKFTPEDKRHPVFTANKETHFEKPSIGGVDVKTFKSGDAILLTGSNFLGVESVTFNGVHSSNFTVLNDGEIVVTVPHGETHGVIAVNKSVPDAEKSNPATAEAEAVVVTKSLESDPFEMK